MQPGVQSRAPNCKRQFPRGELLLLVFFDLRLHIDGGRINGPGDPFGQLLGEQAAGVTAGSDGEDFAPLPIKKFVGMVLVWNTVQADPLARRHAGQSGFFRGAIDGAENFANVPPLLPAVGEVVHCTYIDLFAA